MKARGLVTPIPTTPTPLQFKVCGIGIELDSAHLQFGVKAVSAACDVSIASNRGMASSAHMCQAELAFSCQYTRALDRFICKDPETTPLACLHQVPSRIRNGHNLATLEYADLSIFHVSDVCLLADLKNTDLEKAVRESVLYVINAVSVEVGELHWPIQLGLPSTRKYSELHLYFALKWRVQYLVFKLFIACGYHSYALTTMLAYQGWPLSSATSIQSRYFSQ